MQQSPRLLIDYIYIPCVCGCLCVCRCVWVCIASRCNQYDMTPMQHNANQFSSNRPQTCKPPLEGVCLYASPSPSVLRPVIRSVCFCCSWAASHFVVRGAVVRWRPGDGCTNNGQVIIAWRCKGSHKVSPLMMGVVVRVLMMRRGRRCHSRGRCCCCMLVLLMAAVRLEFRAWYAQLFDLGQIGLHAEVVRKQLPLSTLRTRLSWPAC